MKFLILILILSFSFSAFAKAKFNCPYEKFSLQFITDKENEISLDIFKDKTKIMACLLKVTSFEDGKTSASLAELTRFDKVRCNLLFDKIASGIEVIDQGYIKKSSQSKTASAYLIKNRQPLKCKILP